MTYPGQIQAPGPTLVGVRTRCCSPPLHQRSVALQGRDFSSRT